MALETYLLQARDFSNDVSAWPVTGQPGQPAQRANFLTSIINAHGSPTSGGPKPAEIAGRLAVINGDGKWCFNGF